MLKINCDRCGVEIVCKDAAAVVAFREHAFAVGDKKGQTFEMELCPKCAAEISKALKIEKLK